MILTELRSYISKQGSAARKELAKHFSLSEDGVDAMLEVWVQRGKLSRMVDLDKAGSVRQVRYRTVASNDIQLNVIS